jgi:acetyl-CoA carboxylase carboxyltransferase component
MEDPPIVDIRGTTPDEALNDAIIPDNPNQSYDMRGHRQHRGQRRVFRAPQYFATNILTALRG